MLNAKKFFYAYFFFFYFTFSFFPFILSYFYFYKNIYRSVKKILSFKVIRI